MLRDPPSDGPNLSRAMTACFDAAIFGLQRELVRALSASAPVDQCTDGVGRWILDAFGYLMRMAITNWGCGWMRVSNPARPGCVSVMRRRLQETGVAKGLSRGAESVAFWYQGQAEDQ